MGVRKIVWSKRAVNTFLQVLIWYRDEMGVSASQHFYDGILDTLETLSSMPTIGRRDCTVPDSKYLTYSFLSHPKYRIVYRFTSRILYVVAIRATMMKTR